MFPQLVCRAVDEYEKSLKEPYVPLPDPGVCANYHDQCDVWASAGEVST